MVLMTFWNVYSGGRSLRGHPAQLLRKHIMFREKSAVVLFLVLPFSGYVISSIYLSFVSLNSFIYYLGL